MSHFALLWKARTIEKYRQNYENEKINSIILSKAELPEKTIFRRFKHYSHDMKKHLSRTFSKWYPEGSTVSNFIINFRDMKFPHILLRSAFGFLWGLILTYLCFIFLVFQLSLSLLNATIISSFIGVLLTLGLTLSNRMRCLVFLLIPQLFSRVGRYTLTCYALVLILTGPATNTLKNLEVLSESMACGQEQIKLNVRQINESIKKPYNSIKDAINVMMEKMKSVTSKLKLTLVKINRLMISVASIIQDNYARLESVASKCNQCIGTPYERCIKSLQDYAEKHHTNTNDSLLGSLVDLAKSACSYLNNSHQFCVPPDFVEETFLATIKGKLKYFANRIKSMLFIHIKVQHSYTFVGNISRTPSQVAAGIVTEIRNRADPIFTWLSWSSCVTSLFLLLIIFRAKYYQHMYETRSRFDNRFITKEFRELDLRRLREGRETVLPLNRRERAKYVTTTSFRLVASEKIYLNRSIVFMVITTFKLLIHIVADYSLYWVLDTIKHHGKRQTDLGPGIPECGVDVTGQGFVARFLSSLFHILDIPLVMPTSPVHCLPNPYPPDFKRYGQIGFLILLLWVFALFEPYGLRMRYLIMGHYRPERAKARAVWLYNHILRTRGSFMKFARRKLHREFKYSSYSDMTFKNVLKSLLLPIEGLLNFLGISFEKKSCLLCNITQECEDCNCTLIRCGIRKCPGIYCDSCFTDIGKMCTICMSPADYGDLSDVSLEKGSSDEDSDNDDGNASKRKGNIDPAVKPSDSIKEDHYKESEDDDDGDPFYNRKYNEAYPFLKLSNNNKQLKASSNVVDSIKDQRDVGLSFFDKTEDLYAVRSNNYIVLYKKNEKWYYFKEKTHFSSVENNEEYFKFHYTYEIKECLDLILKFNQKRHYKIRNYRRRISMNLKFTNKVVKCRKKGPDKNTKDKDKAKPIDYKQPAKDKNQPTDKQNKEDTKDKKGKKDKTDKKDTKDKKTKKDTKDKKAKKDSEDKNANKDKKKNRSKKSSKIKKTETKRHFQDMIIKFITCTDSGTSKKYILSPTSNTSPNEKHNRKRKRRKSKSPKRYNKHDSRNYRISSYLSQLEWGKSVNNKNMNTSVNNICQNGKEDVAVEADALNDTLLNESIESHVKIYDVMIPKLKLSFSMESINKKDSKAIFKKTPHITKNIFEPKKIAVKKQNSLCEISNHLKEIVCNSFATNSYALTKKTNKKPDHCKRPFGETKRNNIKVMDVTPRSRRYFEAAHRDLDLEEIYKDLNYSTLANQESLKSTMSDSSVLRSDDASILEKFKDDKMIITDKSDVSEKGTSKVSLVQKSSSDSGWSRLKRVPLSIMKGFLSSLFVSTSSLDKPKVVPKVKNSEKGVLACPNVCSCACQKNFPRPSVHNRHVQIPNMPGVSAHCVGTGESQVRISRMSNDQVNACKSTCTCATQHFYSCRDVGTYKTADFAFGDPDLKRSPDTEPDKLSISEQESQISSASNSLSTTSEYSTESTESSSSFTSRTDTTVCSLATVRTDFQTTPKTTRKRTKVVTLANRGTSTDVAKVCDVSTVTDDWWSPIIEKKVKPVKLSPKSVRIQRVRNKGVMTKAGRIVKFQSRAQIIPRNDSLLLFKGDILSPTRYLLESQKYYNELFSSRYYSPHVMNMTTDRQHYQKPEKKASKMKSRCNYRLNRKTKRLEDSYSPRRWKCNKTT